MATAELAARPTRLADLPASAVLALLDLVPRSPDGLAVLQIRPGPSEGLVVLEVAAPAAMGRLVLEGDASRPIALPRAALALLKRRHLDAQRLVVDQLEHEGPCRLGLRSFGPDCTMAISCPEAAALPELPLLELPVPPSPSEFAGDALPLLLDPALLAKALAVLSRLGINRVRIHPLSDRLVGLVLEPGPGSELAGSLQLARCVLLEAR